VKNGIWVIGDVHGEYDKLVQLLDKLPKDAKVCFCGDLIDRGADSAKVIDLIIDNNYLSVLGNHEFMMLDAYDNILTEDYWLFNGGRATLESYAFKEVYLSHYEFLRSLPLFLHFEFEGYKPLVVSHSYIHADWVDKEYKYNTKFNKRILWLHMNDEKFFTRDKEIKNGIFNIFGHTPVPKPIVTDTYAMIDTGAYYVSNKQLGYLSAIHYPSLEVIRVF